MNAYSKKKILIGISSGIAGYKIARLIKELLIRHNVTAVMTENAVKMFGKEMFRFSGRVEVYSELFPEGFDYKNVLKKRSVDHVMLSDESDLIVIAPATANIIAKIAAGISDDLLTTVVTAYKGKVMVFPSMNPDMWSNEKVRENVSLLKKRGFMVYEPLKGPLACGYEGKGRLPESSSILEEINRILDAEISLQGKKVLVTGGASCEYIDQVRIITNRGSGKMGKEICDECYLRGAYVTYVRAKTAGVSGLWNKEITFMTSDELRKILNREVKTNDYIFHSASVSDFRPKREYHGKLDSGKVLNLELEPVEKIINSVKKINPNIVLTGFKAVYGNDKKKMYEAGREKMFQTGADFMVVNDVKGEDKGFSSDYNECLLLGKSGQRLFVKRDLKRNIAAHILDFVIRKAKRS